MLGRNTIFLLSHILPMLHKIVQTQKMLEDVGGSFANVGGLYFTLMEQLVHGSVPLVSPPIKDFAIEFLLIINQYIKVLPRCKQPTTHFHHQF
jgi:hypothetical protein